MNEEAQEIIEEEEGVEIELDTESSEEPEVEEIGRASCRERV